MLVSRCCDGQEVLQILQLPDDRECENGLTHVLGFDKFKFDFVKLLMRNRCVAFAAGDDFRCFSAKWEGWCCMDYVAVFA